LKKLLLVSFYYSPCTLTPSQRITFWAENFYKLGYYPIVVTRAWSSEIKTHHDTKMSLGKEVSVHRFPTHEVHYLPFSPGMLDKAYLKFGETALRPLFLLVKLLDVLLARFTLKFTSYSNFLPYLHEQVKSHNPEKMIVSGEPFYLFRLGYSLFKKTGLSWIADYRDDWSTNELQMQKSGGLARRWIATLESRYEKKWVGTSEAIISVSKAYTERIMGFLKKPGVTVQNGFEESLLTLQEKPLYDQFTVMYSGVLYPSQDIRMVLEVLDRCYQIGLPFRLVFLGAGFDVKEKKRIESLVVGHLKPYVEVTDRYPRSEAIEKLQQAHLLLGIAYGTMKGIPSSKLYEYLALGKPVLLCPTDGDVMEEILKESGLGYFCKDSNKGAELVLQIMELYKDSQTLQKQKEQARELILPYSRFHQLKHLAENLG
jgi:glycosyltransferase involved in cell wall biosynthesis